MPARLLLDLSPEGLQRQQAWDGYGSACLGEATTTGESIQGRLPERGQEGRGRKTPVSMVLFTLPINIFSLTPQQAAKKMDPSFLMRYAIFTREQQHTQKSADGAGGKSSSRAAATDLVSYVEFQRNYKYVGSSLSGFTASCACQY
jgi:hypothetical protein